MVLSAEQVASRVEENAHQFTSSRWFCKLQMRDTMLSGHWVVPGHTVQFYPL